MKTNLGLTLALLIGLAVGGCSGMAASESDVLLRYDAAIRISDHEYEWLQKAKRWRSHKDSEANRLYVERFTERHEKAKAIRNRIREQLYDE